MGLTKLELAELVIARKTGGQITPEKKIDAREVMKYIDAARNYLIEKSFNQARNIAEYSLPGEFISIFKNVAVLNDTDRNLKYSDLPARLVTLRGNRGLRQISPMQSESVAFIITQSGSNFIYDGLEAGNPAVIGTTSWLEKDEATGKTRIYHKNIPVEYEKILVKMVASIDDLDENTAIPVPAEAEMELIELVMQAFSEQQDRPQDKVNDNNPTI